MLPLKTWFTAEPRTSRVLVTVNVVAYLLWALVLSHVDAANTFVTQHLAFDPSWPKLLYKPWSLITYSFLHLNTGFNGLWYVVLNTVCLYWVGRNIEEAHAPHTVLILYLYAAAGGALLGAAVYPFVSEQGIILHGATGPVMGLLCALSLWQPNRRFDVWFIRPIPPYYVLMALAVVCVGVAFASPTTIFAQLGAIAVVALVLLAEVKGVVDLMSWARWFYRARDNSLEGFLTRIEHRLSKAPLPEQVTVTPEPSRSTEAELDRILDKINEKGLDSLSPEERAVLESFSRSK